MITRNSRGTKRFTATAAAAAVVASTLAISGSAAAVVGVATDRIGGDNRYDTAGLIADEAFTAPVADILLASGLVFADALAGNALAGAIDGPILLTNPDSLSADTAASIQALSGPGTTVHILGETAAVSAAVEAEVAALGVATNRFGGSDRFETAAEIAEFVDANATIPGLNETKTVIVATGMNFPDALAGGPLAFVGPHPILLVRTDSVPAATAAAITNIGADEVIILGGPAAVSDAVATELEALTGNPAVRLAGDNRWGTAAEVADAAQASFGFPGDEVLLANGLMFADALAGGPLGGSMQAPIVLTREASLPADTCTLLTDNNDVVANITALGLQAAIDDATLAAAAACAELPAPTSNQTFAVTPADPAINTVSTTTGDNQNRGARTYTVDVGDATAVDIALVNQSNVTVDANGVVSFRDVDSDQNRADGLGQTAAVIETVNGVAIAANDYVNNVATPTGTVTFTVDSTTPNTAVIPVVFQDADNNNQLNLDADNLPSEDFGIGGSKLFIPTEAAFGTFTNQNAIIALQAADFFTAFDGTTNRTFNYSAADDTFRYDSGTAPVVGITPEQFEMWLSGVGTNPGNIPDINGDVLTVNYNPAGPSVFTIVDDKAMAPTNVTATVTDADTDGAADDILVDWDRPTNPDVFGYDVWFRYGTTGGWTLGGFTTATELNHLNQAPAAGTRTVQYQVVPINSESVSDGFAAAAQVIIESAGFTAHPISVATNFDHGAGQTPPPVVAPSTGDNTRLDSGDALDITYTNIGAGLTLTSPTITIRDLDGTTVTLNSSNAQFTLGAVTGASQVLSIVLTSNPTPAANGSDTVFDTQTDVAAFVSSTGIANSNGAWNLAASGCDDQCNLGFVAQRTFDNDETGDNDDLPEALVTSDVSAAPASDTITVAAGAANILNGQPFSVFNGVGAQIASGTYNSGTGTTVTASPGFAPGDTLYIVYTTRGGTGNAFDRLPSETLQINNPSDIPTVDAVNRVGSDLNTVDVVWEDDDLPDPVGITQVGPASNYKVYDAANNVLIATGEATSGSANGTLIGTDTIRVDFNADLTPGANYTLRVAADTVQDPNNLPNVVQVFPFTFNNAPAVAITAGPTGPTNDTTPTFSGTASDDVDITDVQVDIVLTGSAGFVSLPGMGADCDGPSTWGGATNTNINWSCTTNPALPAGSYTFNVRALDSNGAVSTVATRAFSVSTNLPTITQTGFIADVTNNVSPTATGTAADSDGTITLIESELRNGVGTVLKAFGVDDDITANGIGTANASWSWTPTPALADGSYRVTFRATDNNGNTVVTAADLFTVDTIAPAVTITSPTTAAPQDRTEGTNTSIFGNVVEANFWSLLSQYRVSGSGDPWTTFIGGNTFSGVGDGPFGDSIVLPDPDVVDVDLDIRVVVTDAAGNSSSDIQTVAYSPLRDVDAPTVNSASGTGTTLTLNMSEPSTVSTIPAADIEIRNSDGTIVIANGTLVPVNGTATLSITLDNPLLVGGNYTVWIVNDAGAIVDNDADSNDIGLGQKAVFTAT